MIKSEERLKEYIKLRYKNGKVATNSNYVEVNIHHDIEQVLNMLEQIRNNVNSKYGFRKAHGTPENIDVPYMTLCEEILEILGDNNE